MRLPAFPSARHPATLLLIVLTLAAPRAGAVESADAIGPQLVSALAAIEPLARSGVLLDRVVPLAGLDRWNASDAPPLEAATWRQGLDELRRASLAPSALPEPAALLAAVRVRARSGVIPLGLIDRGFERIRPEALAAGIVRSAAGRVELAGPVAADAVLERGRAFAVAALVPETYRGGEAVFTLDPERIFADAPWRSLAIDFGDGTGFRAVAPGARLTVRFATTGRHTMVARLVRADGSVAVSRSAFDVAALANPAPDDTLHVTATIPYLGGVASGDAYVYRAPGRAAITNPIVVIEGFDFNNTQNWDELYVQLNTESLIEQVRADGFDAVVLNFADATEYVQRNAFLVLELVQQLQAAIPQENSIALVGASMGGLCSRFALAYMETHGLPHRVRTWISFDSPHGGADIPLGLQYWIDFFAGQSADAAAFRNILNRPAARQMLIYHYGTPPANGTEIDALRAGLAADFAALGNWPTLTRRVAIANGSGSRTTQGFGPGAQLIRWEYSSFLVSITGNVWAVPNGTTQTIFRGNTRIGFVTNSRTVQVTYTRPWDGAPGGFRPTMAELDAVAAPYGDIVALYPAHDFIPAVSALGLPTSDPFFDIAGTPGLVSLTPFDAVYYPAANQEHVLVTPQNAVWVRQEVEQGVVSAPAGAPAAALHLVAAPNPARGAVTFAFALPPGMHGELRIFGVDGREVSAPIAATPGGTLRWDGLDRRGARVPAGVYFARLDAGSKSVARRFVLVD